MSLEEYRQPLRLRMSFQPALCVGCCACVTACMDRCDWNPELHDPCRRVLRAEEAAGDDVSITYYSVGCLHCPEAPCMDACPQGCFTRDTATGAVLLDPAHCTGCGKCAGVCAYRGIVMGHNQKAAKCDGCIDRLRAGALPACVRACPRDAITVDIRGPLLRDTREKLAADLRERELIDRP